LLLDLALSFYGDTLQSLDAFLASGFAVSNAEPITEADLRKRLRQEQQAAAALTGVWQSEETQRIGDLLRPFALLFDRRELPAFDFQLNEAFQIAQLGGSPEGSAMLESGDRILAVNNHRLVLPDDLLKCRSRLTPGQEVQLDVERRSIPLRVTHRVAKEVMLELEINKLADADKQQKLEQFLSVEAEEN
jgi:predicted metalloprotease with PDZ domain